jgi:hypothetical protein
LLKLARAPPLTSRKLPVAACTFHRWTTSLTRTAKRQALQKDLRALAASIRADAEGRYDSAEPGWRAGVEWTLLWIENTTGQLTEGKP